MSTVIAIVAGVLGVAQMVYNVILGYWVRKSDQRERQWQQREEDREKTEHRRESDITGLRNRCDNCRREIDERCQAEQRENSERHTAMLLRIEGTLREVIGNCATKQDLEHVRKQHSDHLTRLFQSQDKTNQGVAAIEAVLKERQ